MLGDKVAIVTGGGTGIGKAIAKAFVENGASVAICSRNVDRLRQAATEICGDDSKVLAIRTDVGDKDEIKNTIKTVVNKWGKIDILVNNAGISGRTSVNEDDNGLWERIIATNLTGMYRFTTEVLKYMKDDAGGRIVNVSSVLGKFGVPGYSAYCASKHGVVGLTKALALEVVERGITVNAICPGWVDTEMAWKGIKDTAKSLGITSEQFERRAMSEVPLGRMLDPSEVTGLVLYLTSDASRGMTGQAINISGGATMA